MAQAPEQQQVLDKLRKDLLEFVLEEATERALIHKDPKVSAALNTMIGNHVKAAVAEALSPEQVAKFPAAAKRQKETGQRSSDDELALGLENIVRPGGPTDNSNLAQTPSKRWWAPRWFPRWAMETAGGLVIVAILLSSFFYYYSVNTTKIHDHYIALGNTKDANISKLCEFRRQAIGQATLLRDTNIYRSACPQGAKPATGPACLLVTTIDTEQKTPGPCSK